MGPKYAQLRWSLSTNHPQSLKMFLVFVTCALMAISWSHPSLWTWWCVSDSCSLSYSKPCSNRQSPGTLALRCVTWFQSMLDMGNISYHLYPDLPSQLPPSLWCSILPPLPLAAGSSILSVSSLIQHLIEALSPLRIAQLFRYLYQNLQSNWSLLSCPLIYKNT